MAFGIDDAINAGMQLINKFVPDPAQKVQAETDLRNALMAADASQNAVNAAEAANPNGFTSGWRPFIGWVCGAALAYQYVVTPLIIWLAAIAHYPLPIPPRLDDTLWQLMFGMLGMGGLRTYEKIKGVAK